MVLNLKKNFEYFLCISMVKNQDPLYPLPLAPIPHPRVISNPWATIVGNMVKYHKGILNTKFKESDPSGSREDFKYFLAHLSTKCSR